MQPLEDQGQFSNLVGVEARADCTTTMLDGLQEARAGAFLGDARKNAEAHEAGSWPFGLHTGQNASIVSGLMNGRVCA